jgi:hypothetical protein
LLHTVLGLAALILALGAALQASDHLNTEEGLPIQIEDAYPIEYKSYELQFSTRYDDLEEDGPRWLFNPELQAGLFPNTEIWIAGSILTPASDEESTAESGFLYNFNTETLTMPAFAIAGKAEFDFNGSTEWTIRGIMTRSAGANSFDFNADYIVVGNPEPGERGNRYRYGLAWTRPLSLDMLFLADIFTERSRLEGEDAETIAEVGLRYQLSPNTMLAGGLGVGLSGGAGSRKFSATLGVSRSF